MNATEKYTYWLEHAQYDMRAVKAMLDTGMWVYAVLMCQQAIEKLAKGVYGLFINADNIPRVHNILRLVKEVEDKLQKPVKEEYFGLFETLSGYYLSSRYPDFTNTLAKTITENDARELHRQSEEAFAWLQTLKP